MGKESARPKKSTTSRIISTPRPSYPAASWCSIGPMKLSSQASSLPSSRLACAPFWLTASIAALLSSIPPSASAETWTIAGGSSWGTAANWNSTSVPNAIGASATFNGAATGSNAAQTANRTITLDGARTVGAIVFNTDLSTFTNQLATGTGGSLIFDALGAGPATITTMGAGTGNNTISGPMTLTDSLTAIVNNTTASSPAGSLNLTGTIGGPGGFTKQGDGLATFGTGAKTYTGATLLSGGRMHGTLDPSRPIRDQEGEFVHITIGAGSWIGAGAIVMADIGRDSIIGAGAVVTRPIPASVVAAGVPARVLHSRISDSAGPPAK